MAKPTSHLKSPNQPDTHPQSIYRGKLGFHSLPPLPRPSARRHAPVTPHPTPLSLAHLSLPHSPFLLSPSQCGRLPGDGNTSPCPWRRRRLSLSSMAARAMLRRLSLSSCGGNGSGALHQPQGNGSNGSGTGSGGGALLPEAPPPAAPFSPELLHRRCWHHRRLYRQLPVRVSRCTLLYRLPQL